MCSVSVLTVIRRSSHPTMQHSPLRLSMRLKMPSSALIVPRAPLRGFKTSAKTRAISAQPPVDQGNLPNSSYPITTNLAFFDAVSDKIISAYRVMDGDGEVYENAQLPDIDEAFARKIYETMNLLPTMDTILTKAQHEAKISFYLTSHGEEAAIVGSAAALAPTDEVLTQYRESGILLWRGFSIRSFIGQCFGNLDDEGTKGRQMPIHFGSPAHHFHSVSSILATQISHAAGVGYALKRDEERRGKDITAVYFGEGTASEGDFHAGMLFSSVLGCPTVFFCRNNGFAISTPTSEQYVGDGIASRGPGYGVKTIRVDGNDVLAVLAATREARKIALHESKPVLVEAMTYRVGHHSAADDSTTYRSKMDPENWRKTDNPIWRMRKFLERKGWWNAKEEQKMKERQLKEILEELERAEKIKLHPLGELFTDVYGGDMPWNLKEQKDELSRLLKKYAHAWGPWKRELLKYEGNGKELM